VDQVAVLHPDALVVLCLLVELDVFELLLELEGVTHLVEKEGNHDVAPARVRIEALSFRSLNTCVELVTVWQGSCKIAADKSSEIQPWVHPAFVGLFVEGSVIREVIFVVNSVDCSVDAVRAVRVPVVQLETNQERVKFQVAVRLGVRNLERHIVIVRCGVLF